jgi:transcriptional regulator GlxA family with amidase domain
MVVPKWPCPRIATLRASAPLIRAMKDFNGRKQRPAETDPDTDLNSHSSRWSVSAIVMLGDPAIAGGRPMKTHWRHAPLLAESFPAPEPDGDRVFVRDGRMVMSAGSSPAIDLDLSLIGNDSGKDVSLYVARRLVVLLKRPDDPSQISMHLSAHPVDRSRLFHVQQYILSHPEADLSIHALARVAAMSARNFARVFRQEVGVSPSDYVDLARIDVARFMLEGSHLPIALIAAKSGFGSPRAMRRAFLAHLGATPTEYRDRFRGSGAGSGPSLSENG